jgi:hypothetical protein
MSDEGAEEPAAKSRRFRFSLMAILTATGVIIAAAGGGVALLFQFEPNFAPCIGGANATFTGAPVYPHFLRRVFLEQFQHASSAQAKMLPNEIGAAVLYTFKADNLRGDDLVVDYTLVRVDKQGTITGVVPGEVVAEAQKFSANSCSETFGQQLFVQTPGQGRYRIVLDLYPLTNRVSGRLALYESPPFEG